MSEDEAGKTVLQQEERDGIAILKLNRPERGNAVNLELDRELARQIDACGSDDSIRAVVITGVGDVFSVGADIEEEDNLSLAEEEMAQHRAEFMQAWQIPKPVIGALNGHCIGGSMSMALHYDLRIAAEESKYNLVFVQRGMTSEHQSAWLLPRLVGGAATLDLMLTGRTITGAEAAEIGLVNEAHPSERVLDRALEIADYIAQKCSPVAVATTKRLAWTSMGMFDVEPFAQAEDSANRELSFRKDTEEAIMSFLERRPAKWTESPTRNLPDIKI